jgi:hypothetical protein
MVLHNFKSCCGDSDLSPVSGVELGDGAKLVPRTFMLESGPSAKVGGEITSRWVQRPDNLTLFTSSPQRHPSFLPPLGVQTTSAQENSIPAMHIHFLRRIPDYPPPLHPSKLSASAVHTHPLLRSRPIYGSTSAIATIPVMHGASRWWIRGFSEGRCHPPETCTRQNLRGSVPGSRTLLRRW